MTQLKDLACHLLRVEQQLLAYQQLHKEELAELWQTLNECKRAITTTLSDLGTETYAGEQACDPILAQEMDSSEHQEETGEQGELSSPN